MLFQKIYETTIYVSIVIENPHDAYVILFIYCIKNDIYILYFILYVALISNIKTL